MQPSLFKTDPPFDGETFEPDQDQQRLTTQLDRVRNRMMAGEWLTLETIHKDVGGSEAGVSARLRDLRKLKHGAWIVERRRIGGGLFVYRLMFPLDSHAQKA